MPYHGIKSCKCGVYGTFKLLRDCDATGIVKCSHCGNEKRVKWSLYVRREHLKPYEEPMGERTANARRIEGCMY